jgi:hypothetical protein
VKCRSQKVQIFWDGGSNIVDCAAGEDSGAGRRRPAGRVISFIRSQLAALRARRDADPKTWCPMHLGSGQAALHRVRGWPGMALRKEKVPIDRSQMSGSLGVNSLSSHRLSQFRSRKSHACSRHLERPCNNGQLLMV